MFQLAILALVWLLIAACAPTGSDDIAGETLSLHIEGFTQAEGIT